MFTDSERKVLTQLRDNPLRTAREVRQFCNMPGAHEVIKDLLADEYIEEWRENGKRVEYSIADGVEFEAWISHSRMEEVLPPSSPDVHIHIHIHIGD